MSTKVSTGFGWLEDDVTGDPAGVRRHSDGKEFTIPLVKTDKVTGGVKNLNLSQYAYPISVHRPPTALGFAVPSAFKGIEVYGNNGTYTCNITPESLIDTTGYAKTYYVDNVGGNNANSGLTWALRKKSIGNAIRAASTSGIASRILVWNSGVPYYRTVSATDDSNDIVSAVPLLIEAMNGRIETGTFDILTWTLASGQTKTYQATKSAAGRVFNTRIKDSYGIPIEYKWVASIAAVEAEAGTWYTDATTVYVRPHDDTPPDVFNARVIYTAKGFNFKCNQDLIVRGFEFQGGQDGAFYAGSGSTNKIVLDDTYCRFPSASNTYAGATTYASACQIYACAVFAAFNSRADKGSQDGFNVHQAGGVVPAALVVNCEGHMNGLNASSSNNGWATHDAVKSIAIGGDWRGNYGACSAHVNTGTQCWEVGSIAGSSPGDLPYSGTLYGAYGVWGAGKAEHWIENCRDVGAEIGVYQAGGCAAYIRNHRGSGQRSVGVTTF